MIDYIGGMGGDGSQTYDEAENTLRSMSVVRILHLVSAGKIGGFPFNKNSGIRDPLTASYVDDVPVKYFDSNNKAVWNTGENIKIDWRDGSPSQTVIPGFAETGVSTTVGQNATTSTPIVRSHSTLADAVFVTVGFPDGLFNQTDTGISAADVNFQIQSRTGAAGTWVVIHNITLSDKATSYAELTYRVPNPVNGSTWQTRLVRITADNSSTRLKTNISYARAEELTINNSSYNGYSVIGCIADGKSFNSGSVPSQTFLLDGLYIPVPNVYTVGYYDSNNNGAYVNPSYTGPWNGVTFKNSITSNPVWILYYLLTDPVNGLGDTVKATDIDVYSFYDAAQYCDALITITVDGVSKTVPRFRLDWQFTGRDDALSLLNVVAGSFNARLTYADGKVGLVVDKPASATRMLNNASVLDGRFEWYSTPRSNRTTAVNATFYNELNNYRPETFTLTADEYFGATADGGGSYITNMGYNPEDIVCVGAVTKNQALRQSRYVLEAALKQTEYVKFKLPTIGMNVQPGEVIYISDDHYSGINTHGRVLAVTGTYVDVDMAVSCASGATIRFNTGANGQVAKTTSAAVSNSSRIYITGGTTGILDHDEWTLNTSIPQMRVVSIKEADGDYEIDCKFYDSSSFTRVETGIAVVSTDKYRIDASGIAVAPANLAFKTNLININGTIQRNLMVSWGGTTENVKTWNVIYSNNGGQKISTSVDQPSIELNSLPAGFIEVWVNAVSTNGMVSDASYAKYTFTSVETVGGVLNAPTNIGVNGTAGLIFTSKDLIITWDNPSTNAGYQIKDSKLTIMDSSNTVLRIVYVDFIGGQTRHSYVYTFEQNVSDGGPRRDIRVNVQLRDVNLRLSSAG